MRGNFFKALLSTLIVYLSVFSGSVQAQEKDDFLPGIIQLMTGEDDLWKSKLQSIVGDHQLEKRFPKASKPRKAFNKRGEKQGDLSGLYTLRFSENVDVEQAAVRIAQLPGIVHAEPHYLPRLCYIPGDDSVSEQYALSRIQAFAGWDLHRGDTNMVIGITDTGVEIFHPDIYPSIARNYNDLPDGIDNDNDGYTDNYYGWDTGDNDSDPSTTGSPHGQHISGIASAATDNTVGIAGSGFNCRFIPIKIMNSSGQLSGAYEGLMYAAEMGCKVINCSWGGYTYSAINAEILRYVSINLDCLVFCGAGNDNNERLFYPASYPYAVSIGATNALDLKADFSNYGGRLDLFAPGDLILSTWTNGGYQRSGGTSMSSPLTAGCAAILRSAFPAYTGQQILYQLKTTADAVELLPGNSAYAGKMGSGRVNLFRALSEAGQPAVVLIEPELTDIDSELFLPGDTIHLSGTLINYLADAQNVVISLSCPTENLEILNPERAIGPIASLNMNNISSDPFVLVIDEDVTFNEDAILRLLIEADGTTLTQTIPLKLYADFINLRHNDVFASISGNGRIGLSGNQYLQGLGIRPINGPNAMFEAGIMFSPFEGIVADGVRGNSQVNDWTILERFVQTAPYEGNTVKYRSAMNCVLPECPVFAETRLFADSSQEFRQFVVLDYTLRNESPINFTEAYWGIFADWDLGNYAENRALYNSALKLQYVFQPGSDTIYAGIQLLGSHQATAHALENSSSPSGPINISDGFSEEEKRLSLSLPAPEGGLNGNGSDVITVTSAGPLNIASGQELQVGFAIHLASSENELFEQAANARNYYLTTVTPLQTNQQWSSSPTPYVYPNPASNVIRIKPDISFENIEMYDCSGRLVFEIRPSAEEREFALPAGIAGGLYIVKLQGKHQNYLQRMLIE